MSSRLVDLTFLDNTDDENEKPEEEKTEEVGITDRGHIDNNDHAYRYNHSIAAPAEEIEPIGAEISVDVVDMADFEDLDDADADADDSQQKEGSDCEEVTEGHKQHPAAMPNKSDSEVDSDQGDTKMAAKPDVFEPVGVNISVDIVDMAEFEDLDDADDSHDRVGSDCEVVTRHNQQYAIAMPNKSDSEVDPDQGDTKMAAKPHVFEPVGVHISVDIVDMAELEDLDDAYASSDKEDCDCEVVTEQYTSAVQNKLDSEMDVDQGDAKVTAKPAGEGKPTLKPLSQAPATTAVPAAGKGKGQLNSKRSRGESRCKQGKLKKLESAANDKKSSNADLQSTTTSILRDKGEASKKKGKRGGLENREQKKFTTKQRDQQEHQPQLQSKLPINDQNNSNKEHSQKHSRAAFASKEVNLSVDDEAIDTTSDSQGASVIKPHSQHDDPVGVDMSVDVVDLLSDDEGDKDDHTSQRANKISQSNAAPAGKGQGAADRTMLAEKSDTEPLQAGEDGICNQGKAVLHNTGKPNEKVKVSATFQQGDRGAKAARFHHVKKEPLKRARADSNDSKLAKKMGKLQTAEPVTNCKANLPPRTSYATMSRDRDSPSRLSSAPVAARPIMKKSRAKVEIEVECVELLHSDSDEEETKAATNRKITKSETLASEEPIAPSLSARAGALSVQKIEDPTQQRDSTASLKREDLDCGKGAHSSLCPEKQNISTTKRSKKKTEEPDPSCRNFVIIDDSSDDSDSDIECYDGPTASKKQKHRPTGGKAEGPAYRPPRRKTAMKKEAPNAFFRRPYVEPSYQPKRDYDYTHSTAAAAEMQDRLFQETINRLRSRRDYYTTNAYASAGANNAASNAAVTNTCEKSQVLTSPLLDIDQRYPNHWQWRDPYARLGLPNRSPSVLVKTHYRKLAKKYHPDKMQFDDSSARFLAITAAYRKLTG